MPKSTKITAKLVAAIKPVTTAPHLIIIARAGTGKTTTLVEGLKYLRGLPTKITPSTQQQAIWDSLILSKDAKSVGFVAFNKAIADELKTRVPAGCDAMTMHSMGLKAVKNAYKLIPGERGINAFRVDNIIEEVLGQGDIREIRRKQPTLVSGTKDLVSIVKMTLSETDTDTLDSLCGLYGIDVNGSRKQIFDLVPKVLERCMDVNRDGCVDYNDMVWLPVAMNLTLPYVYDLLLVDEAQDLNRCQQSLVKRAGKRLIFCGDPKQAIYGFAGADAESMNRLQSELNAAGVEFDPAKPNGPSCTVLPLTVTRRCGRKIVAEANKIVPDFSAHESNPEGKITNARYSEGSSKGKLLKTYHDMAQEGDMVICRVNAPLVSQCFKFIKMGRKATILGRDIGQGLISLINKLGADSLDSLRERLNEWADGEVRKEQLKKFPSEFRLIAIQDKQDCLNCFIDEATQVTDVIARIQSIFVDTKGTQGIRLSSMHKAKGLESRQVFILQLKGASCPHPMAKTAMAQDQEQNLLYVGITRAIEHLVYVFNPEDRIEVESNEEE